VAAQNRHQQQKQYYFSPHGSLLKGQCMWQRPQGCDLFFQKAFQVRRTPWFQLSVGSSYNIYAAKVSGDHELRNQIDFIIRLADSMPEYEETLWFVKHKKTYLSIVGNMGLPYYCSPI
jgi:hypothetical protein